MAPFWDFFGFSSKRHTALEEFDRALSQLQVNPATIDDGMRYAIYAAIQGFAPKAIDQSLRDAARLISFCVLGPSETTATWGPEVSAAQETRLLAAVEDDGGDSLDAKVVKLVLLKGIASPEVTARVALD